MKIVFGSDSFKGSLSSGKICEILERTSNKIFPNAETQGVWVADGGEGTLDAVLKERKGEKVTVAVHNPLFERTEASYALFDGKEALIEMASASGLTLIEKDKRNPLKTTSFGTGELIRDAIDRGCKKIILAIGGSATNDGGMGAMSALGFKFLDRFGNVLRGTGEELEKTAKIEIAQGKKLIEGVEFQVMCDVTNPLLGENGSSYVFAPQKGADSQCVNTLERGMEIYSHAVKEAVGKDFSQKPGAGAAGGMGFALMAFLGAQIKSGIDTVLDLIDFDEKIKSASLVITGEGRMDGQSVCGKVPYGVGMRCRKYNIPCVAVVGGLLEGYEKIYDSGIKSVITTINGEMSLEYAIENSERLYEDAAFRLLSAVKCGMEMKT